MKHFLRVVLKNRLIRALCNPRYSTTAKVESGNICVVPGDTNRLGDLVMNNYFIRQLQKDYTVTYGLADWYFEKNSDFLENHCFAKDFLIFPAGLWKRILFIFRVRKKKFHAVVLLPYKPHRIDIFFYLAGVPVICDMPGSSMVSTHHYNFEKFADQNHYTSATNCILDALHCSRQVALETLPWFPYRKMNIEECRSNGTLSMVVHIGGATYWLRRWPPEKYLDICRLFLNHYQGRIYLVGGKEEIEENELLKNTLMEEFGHDRVFNFCGRNLNTFANILAASEIFLGNDSGPMHVATALRIRVVCIFGPSNIPYVNPTYVDKKNITIHSDLECVPCNKEQCALPAGQQFSCLNDLPVKMVWRKLQRVLEEINFVKRESKRQEA